MSDPDLHPRLNESARDLLVASQQSEEELGTAPSNHTGSPQSEARQVVTPKAVNIQHATTARVTCARVPVG